MVQKLPILGNTGKGIAWSLARDYRQAGW
jgi:hypothetical protein